MWACSQPLSYVDNDLDCDDLDDLIVSGVSTESWPIKEYHNGRRSFCCALLTVTLTALKSGWMGWLAIPSWPVPVRIATAVFSLLNAVLTKFGKQLIWCRGCRKQRSAVPMQRNGSLDHNGYFPLDEGPNVLPDKF